MTDKANADSQTAELPETMKVITFPGGRTISLEKRKVPTPGAGQVLLQTRASSLCGSDLRLIYRPQASERVTGPDGYQLGVAGGHEPSGIVVRRGPGVGEKWTEGTRVVVYHIQGCGDCLMCRQGRYISCESPARGAYGYQRDGGHAEYILADTQSLVALPEPLTYLDGALVACGLGTAYGACVRASISGADRVLVTGLGPVGLGVALVAQKLGARVLGLERDPSRVAVARALGIESIPTAGSDSEDIAHVLKWADGVGPEVAIDCSGNAGARATCVRVTRVWGRVVFVGEGGRVDLDVSEWVIHKNLTIYGSWVCSIGEMEELVELLVRWDLHPEVTVTNTFAIDEGEEAYRLFDSGKTGKCAILFGGETQRYRLAQLSA